MSTIPPARKGYPTDVSDDEWALVAPYLSLLSEDALQRRYPLREVFNALRWLARTGAHDFEGLSWRGGRSESWIWWEG